MAVSVCVIGAGPSGIAILKCLADYPDKIRLTCYEQTPHIGGTWVYTDRIGTDENGIPIHTSMYKDLVTNLPKCLMELDGLSMPEELPSFIQHSDFLKYLEDYCEMFNLKEFIQFKTKVYQVTPVTNCTENKIKWSVKTMRYDDDVTKDNTFDAVVVCNGHFSVPYIPDIPGLDTFQGKWIHGRDYRFPEKYTGQTVMCVGGLMSAQDIALQLVPCTKKVYMSHRRKNTRFPDEVCQVPTITRIQEDKVILRDQSEICDIEVLIFCTGYKYSFDFLDKICHPNIDSNNKITPLYQHVVHVEYPSLFFLGLPTFNAPVKVSLMHAYFVTSVLLGRMKLPSKAEMYKHIEFLYAREEAYPNPYYRPLCILYSQWDYYAEMASLGKFDNLPLVIERVFKIVMRRILEDITKLRKYEYEIIDDENFVEKYIED